ncbi:TetR/AcrR family transcriptional regulator [Deinococcus aquiradiocola]|uniref:TetR family transcriptional regulator n=1 Tax=Deinococcus aquiradiocola TaxID=393059 RepID=A0A917ULV4_9DEIO|nr:TetR/AcrR family transcriptional regulator [Deinococcus aquiradiocola]GGJ67515.1 TetR family transcriptional regulator [Deinococcus aquiradiocola]
MSPAPPPDAPQGPQDATRARILDAAVRLLGAEGRDALTTRAVAVAAGVQAPALYRLFGDKRGLLSAVASHGYAAFMAEKERLPVHLDPLDQLRAGWDLQVQFGLTHPAVYALMAGDPQEEPDRDAGWASLNLKLQQLARTGRLSVPVQHAAVLYHSACRGLILTLLSLPPAERDPALSRLARETALAGISAAVPGPPSGVGPVAVQLRSCLPDIAVLTPGERHLMAELLDRIARSGHPTTGTEPS